RALGRAPVVGRGLRHSPGSMGGSVTQDNFAEAAERLHRDSIVYDMVSPLFTQVFPRSVDDYLAGGVSAVGATVSYGGSNVTTAEEGFRGCAHLHSLIRRLPDRLMFVGAADDFARAKAAGKLGVVFHFQTCSPFENRLELVEAFYRLGVRAALLTYN